MKGLYFYKLNSPYQEDITKDCKLTINEIDHNFVTLKNTDIKDITFDEEAGLLTLSQIDGEEFVTKIDLSHFTKDFNVEWDKENSELIFHFDGKEVKINAFTSSMGDDTISQIISDETLIGLGVSNDPLGVNPLIIPGTYKAVECVINKIEGESLPNEDDVKKGDRYLTYEKLNLYGKLYNYEAVKKINEDLIDGWRVPTKEDWDNMLNAIELCADDRNHKSEICNVRAGKYAGKLLKSKDGWKVIDGNKMPPLNDSNSDEPSEKPSSSRGVDSYGFNVVPAGYGDGYGVVGYLSEQTEFWTITETERTDVYTKRFFYDRSDIMQIAQEPKALCSLRLVKDYTGINFKGVDSINGVNYQTVLMPSENAQHGYLIWTALNVSFDSEDYNPVDPNYEEGLDVENVYYINEWDGFAWGRKRLEEGDSLVIKSGPDGENNHEYRLDGNKLVNVKHDLKGELISIIEGVNNTFTEINDNINDLQVKNETLRQDLIDNIANIENIISVNKNEVAASLTTLTTTTEELRKDLIDNVAEFTEKWESLIVTDESLMQTIEALREDLTDNVNELDKEVQENEKVSSLALNDLQGKYKALSKELNNNVNELAAKDEALREDLADNVAELTSRLISQEGSSYDCTNGVLTLTTDNPSNTIIIHLTSDYGTF